jgi:hypothetical protein
MSNLSDYESWGFASAQADSAPALLEAFTGTSIVSWYDNIDRQLDAIVDKYQQRHMHSVADRVRTFLNTWRDNEITGSVNRENIEPLKAAAEQCASDDWKLKPYFQNLRGQLRTLEASLEELPSTAFPTPEPATFPTAPPSNFGPQDQAGAPGGPPAPGAGAPPAPGTPPAPGEKPGGPTPPPP